MRTINYTTLADIQREYNSNPGGFYKLLFAPMDDISSIGPFSRSTGTISRISLKPTATWYRAYLPMQQRSYTEQQKEGDAGPYYDISVQGFVPFEVAANHVLLNLLKHYRFIVIVVMPNGITRIVGDMQNGARLSHSFDSGQDFRNVPGTSIVFTWQNEDIAAVYDGPAIG